MKMRVIGKKKKSMYQIYNKETWYGLGKIFLKIRNIKKIKLP